MVFDPYIDSMISTDKLSRAIAFAAIHHAGQKDKRGAEYILHPLRVMLKMDTVEEKIVAVLHDVLEDTDASIDEIEEYFGYEIAQAVLAMTRYSRGSVKSKETYMEYVARAAENPIARKVKREDMLDQLLPEREIPETETLRKRYAKALAYLHNLEDREKIRSWEI